MISVYKLQEALPSAADTDVVLLADMIARAVAFIETQTNRDFSAPATVTQYLSGNGSRTLQLPGPLVQIDSDDGLGLVIEREYPGATETILTSVDVRSGRKGHHLVRLDGVWKAGYEYAVTYTTGYVEDQGPGDIEQLVIDLVGLRLAREGREGLSGETIGGYSYTVTPIHAYDDGDLKSLPGAMATIKAWRLLVIA
jgi:hypothetical protein